MAAAFPDTSIVLDHVGGPLGYASYASRHDEVFATWKKSMAELARRPNITVKVGGLGMAMGWFDFYERPAPPSSQMLAVAFKPWVETCIELFGAERCIWGSDWPFINVPRKPRYADLVTPVARWFPDRDACERVLGLNAKRLFGFADSQ